VDRPHSIAGIGFDLAADQLMPVELAVIEGLECGLVGQHQQAAKCLRRISIDHPGKTEACLVRATRSGERDLVGLRTWVVAPLAEPDLSARNQVFGSVAKEAHANLAAKTMGTDDPAHFNPGSIV
jgi:hypothetical protein